MRPQCKSRVKRVAVLHAISYVVQLSELCICLCICVYMACNFQCQFELNVQRMNAVYICIFLILEFVGQSMYTLPDNSLYFTCSVLFSLFAFMPAMIGVYTIVFVNADFCCFQLYVPLRRHRNHRG